MFVFPQNGSAGSGSVGNTSAVTGGGGGMGGGQPDQGLNNIQQQVNTYNNKNNR